MLCREDRVVGVIVAVGVAGRCCECKDDDGYALVVE